MIEMENEENGISIMDIIILCLKKVHIIFFIVLACLALGILAYQLNKPEYRAKGSILIVEKTKVGQVEKNQINSINSFVHKDFIIMPIIEKMALNISVSEFKEKYTITNTVENGFINIECLSPYEQDNILIINSIIDNIDNYLANNSEEIFDVNLFITEYATYSTVIKSNILMYLVISVGLGGVVSLIFIFCIYSNSKYVLNKNKAEECLANFDSKVISLKDVSMYKVIDQMIDSKIVLVNGVKANSKVIKTLKRIFDHNKINTKIFEYSKMSQPINMVDDSCLLLLCDNEEFNYNTYTSTVNNLDCVVNFVYLNKTKCEDLINFNYLFGKKFQVLNVVVS